MGRDEYDEVFMKSTLGYGGMVIRDGVGHPMSDEEALALAIPQWVETEEDLSAVVALCLRAFQYEQAAVRIVALQAFARLARRADMLPSRDAVERAIRGTLHDTDTGVRMAAVKAFEAFGWT